MYDDLDLPVRLRGLLTDLRDLCFHIRRHRLERLKRVDPFIETLFDRAEKAQQLQLAPGVVLHDSVILCGDVEIGERTFVAQQVTLDGSGGLRIGKGCSIANGVRIMTHDAAKWALSDGKAPIDRAPVIIGDNCFIGVNAVITSGVTIGTGSLVGAGAVVTKDIPASSIAMGVPAKVVGTVQADGADIDYIYLRHGAEKENA